MSMVTGGAHARYPALVTKKRQPNKTEAKAEPKPFLSDPQWLLVADLLPDPPVGPLGGRPWRSSRECPEGVLWVLMTGARWKALSP